MAPVLATFLWQNGMNKVTYTRKHLFGCVVLEGQESTIEQRHGPWNWKTQEFIYWTTSSLQEAKKRGHSSSPVPHFRPRLPKQYQQPGSKHSHIWECRRPLIQPPLATVYLIVSGSVSPWVVMDSHLRRSHFFKKWTVFFCSDSSWIGWWFHCESFFCSSARVSTHF